MNKKLAIVILAATSMCFATKIGVLKRDASYKCPGKQVYFDLDVEDDDNDTKIMSRSDKNDKKIPGINIDGGHAKFTYCVIDSKEMLPVSFDYVVLRLDDSCPKGATEFSFTHDTENDDNANHKDGDISPNVVNKDIVTFEYCFVPKSSKPTANYPFKNVQYGVFANRDDISKKDHITHFYVKIDDEDTKKRNKVVSVTRNTKCTCSGGGQYARNDKCYNAKGQEVCSFWNTETEKWNHNDSYIPGEIEDRLSRIMSSTRNTLYNVIKWTGSASQVLAKSVVAEAPAAPAAAQMNVVPEIKGFDHSSVTVEMQSAGNVDIAIMNVNGVVVAKIAKENLLPGVHVMNWNSSLVPNGRYIVTAKQNGKMNSKVVILK